MPAGCGAESPLTPLTPPPPLLQACRLSRCTDATVATRRCGRCRCSCCSWLVVRRGRLVSGRARARAPQGCSLADRRRRGDNRPALAVATPMPSVPADQNRPWPCGECWRARPASAVAPRRGGPARTGSNAAREGERKGGRKRGGRVGRERGREGGRTLPPLPLPFSPWGPGAHFACPPACLRLALWSGGGNARRQRDGRRRRKSCHRHCCGRRRRQSGGLRDGRVHGPACRYPPGHD
jgi:hypothetical protein